MPQRYSYRNSLNLVHPATQVEDFGQRSSPLMKNSILWAMHFTCIVVKPVVRSQRMLDPTLLNFPPLCC